MAQRGTEKVNQTLPYQGMQPKQGTRKIKTSITYIPRVWPNKVQEMKNKHCHTLGMWPKQDTKKEALM